MRTYLLLLLFLFSKPGENKIMAQGRPVLKPALTKNSGKVKQVPVSKTVKRISSSIKSKSPEKEFSPVVLPAHEMKFERVNASENWPYKLVRDSMLAKSKLFWVYGATLLYRNSLTDTIFTQVELELPDSLFIKRGSRFRIGIIYQDLNRDNSPEVLVGLWLHAEGSSLRSSWVGINLIDISHAPRLLLRATIEDMESGWGRPEPDADEIFTSEGWERAVKLGDWDIRLVAMESGVIAVKSTVRCLRISRASAGSSEFYNGENNLTPLKPGCYSYRGGHLVRTGN